jgi:hypothetical protein
MCGVNHNLFPRPGSLIDISCESIAAKVLFTRMLSHHADIGLRVGEILTGLPGWVRDLLGPQLTTPYRLRSGQAA